MGNSVIVVEGPDGAGKTTLIKGLLELFPALTLSPRVVSKDAKAMVDLVEWVEVDNHDNPPNRIYDRHRMISEPVYNAVLRDRTQPGFDQPVWFMNQMTKFYNRNPLLIYCLPPRDMVKNNVFADPDNKVVQTEDGRTIERIYDLYQLRATLDLVHHSYTLVYDYTKAYAFKQAMLVTKGYLSER